MIPETTEVDITQLQYPIGRFNFSVEPTPEQLEDCIRTLQNLPKQLRKALDGLDNSQLDTPYRPGGWTVRQVVHHLADSHINAYIRFRLALTEDNPVIKPYVEAEWAELPDAKSGPLEPSLILLEGVHERITSLLSTLNTEQFSRTFFHPEKNANLTIAKNTALYTWHSRHHLAHITNLRDRLGWA